MDNYIVKDKSGEILFVIERDGPVSVGEKFGFNMDDAPLVYAVFKVISVNDTALTVEGPERYDKEAGQVDGG